MRDIMRKRKLNADLRSLQVAALLAGILAIACCLRAGAGQGCCSHCGHQRNCDKVCRLVCEEKKVSITCWGTVCEDFCVGRCSERGCRHCEDVCGTCDAT